MVGSVSIKTNQCYLFKFVFNKMTSNKKMEKNAIEYKVLSFLACSNTIYWPNEFDILN